MSAETGDTGTLRAILYDAAGNDREVRLSDIDAEALESDQLLWVDIIGDHKVQLPRGMDAGTGAPAEVGRLEFFDDFFRFAVPLRDPAGSTLTFVVGRSWVLTRCDQRLTAFDDFISADRGETLKGKMTSTAFMASLLIRYLDGFREEIAHVDLAIDRLDDVILRSREKRSPLNSLAALRRRLSELRSVLAVQRGLIHGLTAPDFLAHVSDADRDFLIETNRLYERLEDDIGRARETVIGSFELYASRVAQDTNQLLKVLTIATVITGIIGAVAGVFGMNFDTPIAHSGLPGFLLVTGIMVATSIALVLIAMWRRWV